MVRAFLPQSFPGNLDTNTNFPPQSSIPAGGGVITFDDELIEEVATFFDKLLHNDAGGGFVLIASN